MSDRKPIKKESSARCRQLKMKTMEQRVYHDYLINFIVFLVYYCFVVITAKFANAGVRGHPLHSWLAAGIYIIGTFDRSFVC